MANITLSIDNRIHERMRAYPEIKWTEVVRRAILDYLAKLDEAESIPSTDLWNQLDVETQARLRSMMDHVDLDEELVVQERMHAQESERLDSQLRVERGRE
ncbi:MAG: hypothetical protein JW839_16410 [Candidatus Lokiarchaeota archaeon]|nr:hypothetical protein [Candidatus Lokiarchaeota archaeon]